MTRTLQSAYAQSLKIPNAIFFEKKQTDKIKKNQDFMSDLHIRRVRERERERESLQTGAL